MEKWLVLVSDRKVTPMEKWPAGQISIGSEFNMTLVWLQSTSTHAYSNGIFTLHCLVSHIIRFHWLQPFHSSTKPTFQRVQLHLRVFWITNPEQRQRQEMMSLQYFLCIFTSNETPEVLFWLVSIIISHSLLMTVTFNTDAHSLACIFFFTSV